MRCCRKKHFFLSLVMIGALLMPIEAWAIEPTERQSDVLGYASVLLESAFSEGQADVDVVSGKSWNGWSLGEEIKSYILTDDGVALTPVSYWPVFYGECVVGSIKAVYGDDGSTTYVLTEELAADIEEANRLQSGAVILFDSEWEASIIRDDATAKQMRGLSQEGQNSGMSYTVQQVSCPISFLADDRQNTSNAESMHLNAHADSGELPEEVPSGGISAAYSAPMLNVPKLYQGSKPLCWAYSVASIGQYMTGVTLLTPERIASLTGGTNGEIPTALSYYKYQNSDTSIGATAWEGSALGDWEIQNWISNGIPIYAHLHVSGSSPARRHAVVVCGWNKTSSGAFTVTVMNPGHGAYEIMTKDSGGVLSLQYNSAGFRWDSGGVVLTGWQKPGNGSNWCWMNGNGTREKGWFSPPGDSNYYWFDSLC